MVSWLTVRLSEHEVGSLLELEHEAVVPEELWEQFGPGATGLGWDGALYGLGLFLESDNPLDPAEGALWGTTPEGRQFMTVCAEGWAVAAIAAGDDPERARASAATVLAMYATAPGDESGS